MTIILGRWEIRTIPVKQSGDACTLEYRVLRMSPNVTSPEPDLEEMVGDFITRHVLERDSVFFEG